MRENLMNIRNTRKGSGIITTGKQKENYENFITIYSITQIKWLSCFKDSNIQSDARKKKAEHFNSH
jgi:hypothetical protein